MCCSSCSLWILKYYLILFLIGFGVLVVKHKLLPNQERLWHTLCWFWFHQTWHIVLILILSMRRTQKHNPVYYWTTSSKWSVTFDPWPFIPYARNCFEEEEKSYVQRQLFLGGALVSLESSIQLSRSVACRCRRSRCGGFLIFDGITGTIQMSLL